MDTRLRRAAIAFVALLVLSVPATADASATIGPVSRDTLCQDGWVSPSNGGSGTCSWHGGIADGSGGEQGGGAATVLFRYGVVAVVGYLLHRWRNRDR